MLRTIRVVAIVHHDRYVAQGVFVFVYDRDNKNLPLPVPAIRSIFHFSPGCLQYPIEWYMSFVTIILNRVYTFKNNITVLRYGDSVNGVYLPVTP